MDKAKELSREAVAKAKAKELKASKDEDGENTRQMQCEEGHKMDTQAVEDGLSESVRKSEEEEEVHDTINTQTVAEDEVIVKASVEVSISKSQCEERDDINTWWQKKMNIVAPSVNKSAAEDKEGRSVKKSESENVQGGQKTIQTPDYIMMDVPFPPEQVPQEQSFITVEDDENENVEESKKMKRVEVLISHSLKVEKNHPMLK